MTSRSSTLAWSKALPAHARFIDSQVYRFGFTCTAGAGWRLLAQRAASAGATRLAVRGSQAFGSVQHVCLSTPCAQTHRSGAGKAGTHPAGARGRSTRDGRGSAARAAPAPAGSAAAAPPLSPALGFRSGRPMTNAASELLTVKSLAASKSGCRASHAITHLHNRKTHSSGHLFHPYSACQLEILC